MKRPASPVPTLQLSSTALAQWIDEARRLKFECENYAQADFCQHEAAKQAHHRACKKSRMESWQPVRNPKSEFLQNRSPVKQKEKMKHADCIDSCPSDISDHCQQGRYCPTNIERGAARLAALRDWALRALARLRAFFG